ncbi:MAG: response regulator [Chloroflexota bacterium]|nr:MAG: response regulator [Chloroflexota bacterium]
MARLVLADRFPEMIVVATPRESTWRGALPTVSPAADDISEKVPPSRSRSRICHRFLTSQNVSFLAEQRVRPTTPILVVDDDESIRDLLRAALERRGYVVLTASDGEEALEMLGTVRPALLILDVQMPRLDGWGVMRELRFRRLDIPVVVISALLDFARRAVELGATHHLAKPFRIVELIRIVEDILPPPRDSIAEGAA